MSEVRVAVSNMKVGRGREANHPKITAAIAEAIREHANVLVLPEMCLQGYADFSFAFASPEYTEQKLFYESEGEPIPGPTTELIQDALRGTSLMVQFGLAESCDYGNSIYNSVALVTADRIIGRYRKTHNQPEWPYFDPGQALPVFDTPIGRVGALICYDICFPEAVRALASQGAELILMSTAWPMKGHDRETDYYGSRMELAIHANAFFNQLWIAVSNHCEQNVYRDGIDYYGGSQIVGPRGDAVVDSALEEEILLAEFDIHRVVRETRARDFFGVNLLRDRRPALYESVTASPPPTSGQNALRDASHPVPAGSDPGQAQ